MVSVRLMWPARGMAVLLAGLILALPASAADDKKGGEQIRRLQQKLQALQREQGELAQGKAELDVQLQRQTEQLAAVRRGADGARAQKGALEKALSASTAERDDLRARLAVAEQAATENATLLAASNAALRATDAARLQVEQSLGARGASLTECVSKNASLHQVGVKALTLFLEKTCGGVAAQLEMLTRLKQVGAENMVDELRDQLDAARVQAAATRQQEARQALETRRLDQQRAVQEKAELAARAQKELERTRASQQSRIDQVGKKVMGWLESVEW